MPRKRRTKTRPKQAGDWRSTEAELDPSILERFIAVIAVGAGVECACAQAGIGKTAAHRYIQMGREAYERWEAGEVFVDERWAARDELFLDFYERYRKAQTNTKAYMLGLIHKAASGDWRAAAWLLEKMYPKEFGSRLHLTSAMESGDTVALQLKGLTTEEIRTLRRIKTKMEKATERDKHNGAYH